MPRIKKLKPEEAQKIAAGEVVERPANSVKELIENSIDAGATRIQIYIEDGGKKLIRIVDNGHGMGQEDAHLCFEHHATSKLEQLNDLPNIDTFGFRGEALSSIASVSRVELITRTHEQDSAYKVVLEGGKMISTAEVSHAVGTDLSVKNLFFNVPARQKFLKKRETEWRQINTLVHAFALSNLAVEFSLYSEQKRILFCPATTTLTDRIAQLSSLALGNKPLTLEHNTNRAVTIQGCISNHQHGRYDRSHIFLFVNKRWVKNTHLSRAILKGYDNVLQHGKFPAAVISIDIDPNEVDVNTHPRKEEVTFLHPRRIETAITNAVRACLELGLSEQIQKPVAFADANPVYTQASSRYRPLPNLSTFNSFTPPFAVNNNSISSLPPDFSPLKPINNNAEYSNAVAQQSPNIPVIDETETIPDLNNTYRLIGQFKKTYLLIEQEDGLFLVDQHAAHERILYEKFCKRFKDAAIVTLLFPKQITLSQDDMALITPHLSLLQKNGIQIEPFSSHQLIIQATPVHLKNVKLEELIKQCVGWIQEQKHLNSEDFTKELHFKVRAQMACKAAVKAGDELNMTQMKQLLNDLNTVEHRFTCPHGRPTGWLFHQYDIEKKFKRKL